MTQEAAAKQYRRGGAVADSTNPLANGHFIPGRNATVTVVRRQLECVRAGVIPYIFRCTNLVQIPKILIRETEYAFKDTP